MAGLRRRGSWIREALARLEATYIHVFSEKSGGRASG